MTTLTALVEKNIKKLTTPLKTQEELIAVLRRKLTKKEYKILCFIAEDLSLDEQLKKLSLDEKRYEEVKIKAFKKINFNEIKQELMQ
jgi:hypothetical protein